MRNTHYKVPDYKSVSR